jgi:hypothetical protein
MRLGPLMRLLADLSRLPGEEETKSADKKQRQQTAAAQEHRWQHPGQEMN